MIARYQMKVVYLVGQKSLLDFGAKRAKLGLILLKQTPKSNTQGKHGEGVAKTSI